MMTETLVKVNTLYQYHGGGYDGCFWEWNFAFIDKAGKFHDLFSSGRDGARTLEQLEYHIEKSEGPNATRFDSIYTYNMGNQEALEELARENLAQNLIHIAKPLAELGIELKAPCKECGDNALVTESIGDDPTWQGGLCYANKDLICQDCYGMYSCGHCGEFYGSDHDWSDEEGRCEYCSEDDIK